MMKTGVPRLEISTAEKKSNPYANMSRVVSVESPDSRDGFITTPAEKKAGHHSTELGIQEDGTAGSSLRGTESAQSPMDALRMGMASPFRNFLGLLKPPALPGSSLHGSEESPRASNMSATEVENLSLGSLKLTLGAMAENNRGAEMSSKGNETRRDGHSVVMVAFDANVKEVSHAGIVWAMEHVLKRGDILAVLSVLDSMRGPLGYRVKIGDQKWLSANQKLVEDEIHRKMEVWRNFPGLDNRCTEGGVQLMVTVKAAQQGELEICKQAVKLGARHVVLDKSLKNRRREFYLQNLPCDVTRMRRCGGVDVIRPSLDMAMMMNMVQRNMALSTGAVLEPRSPTSVIPPPLLSYGDQIDVFEISLGGLKPKRVNSHTPKSNSQEFRGPHSSAAYSGELRSSSVSVPSVQASLTSSSNATDMDDDLFSICHGSTRHGEIDTELFSIVHRPSTSGYESDDLFSIGNASARRTSPAPPLEYHHSHSHSHSHSQGVFRPDATIHRPNLRLSLDALAAPTSSSCELVISEPLREATIVRMTFVVGLGEAVTLTLRESLRPGEGLLVGSSPSALFLMQYADAQNAATLGTATPGSYIAMEGRMAMKLAFLEPEQRVLAVDSLGRCRTIPVASAATAATPLLLLEAQCQGRRHSAMLHHTDSVGLCHSHTLSHSHSSPLVSLKSLQVGHRVLLRLRSAEPSHAIWSS